MKHPRKIRVVLIDEVDDFLALAVVRCLQQAGGFDIHCITAEPAHRLRHSIRCKVRHERLDTPADLLDAVRRYNARYPIDIVIPIQETMITMAGAVAGELNELTRLAPVPTPELCDIIDNKWQFSQLMASTSIKMPRSLSSDGERAALERELSEWTAPFLTKPLHGHGGDGIVKYNTRADLLVALDDPGGSGQGPVIIQECIPGQDMGCSFISHEGEILAHTIQKTTLAQHHAFTSGLGLEFVRDDTVSTIAEAFAQATRWTGVANMDLRVDERTGEIYLLEVNPRYWQTLLGSLAMGINFADIHCRLTLDYPIEVQPFRTGRWVNLHALSHDLVNVKRLMASREHSWRQTGIGQALRDPLIEILFFLNAFRRHVRVKVRSSLQRKGKYRISSEAVVD